MHNLLIIRNNYITSTPHLAESQTLSPSLQIEQITTKTNSVLSLTRSHLGLTNVDNITLAME